MKYQIQLSESGSGRSFNITEKFVTLERANELVKELDLRWHEWEDHGFPELVDPNDILGSYEGCDIIAVSEDGKTYLIMDESACQRDAWELLD